MKPNATIAIGLILSLLAGPASAQSQAGTQSQTPPPAQGTQPPPQASPTPTPSPTPVAEPTPQTATISAASLERIRAGLSREPAIRIENGQLRLYVEVIGHWPSFAEHSKGFDFINGGGPKNGNPMSHAEFVAMSTPRDFYGNAGIGPAEVATMAAVNLVGQWALGKAFNSISKWSDSRKEKERQKIRDAIDAELALLKKANEKDKNK